MEQPHLNSITIIDPTKNRTEFFQALQNRFHPILVNWNGVQSTGVYAFIFEDDCSSELGLEVLISFLESLAELYAQVFLISSTRNRGPFSQNVRVEFSKRGEDSLTLLNRIFDEHRPCVTSSPQHSASGSEDEAHLSKASSISGSESMKNVGKPPSKQNAYTVTLEEDVGKLRILEIIFVLGKYEATKTVNLFQLKAHYCHGSTIHQGEGRKIQILGTKEVIIRDKKAVFSDFDYRTGPHLPSGTYHARYLLHPSTDDPHERLLDIHSHDFDVRNRNKTEWKALDFNKKLWKCGDVPRVTFNGRFNGDRTRYCLQVKQKSYSPIEAKATKLIFQLEPEMEECEVSPIIVFTGNGTPEEYEFTKKLIFFMELDQASVLVPNEANASDWDLEEETDEGNISEVIDLPPVMLPQAHLVLMWVLHCMEDDPNEHTLLQWLVYLKAWRLVIFVIRNFDVDINEVDIDNATIGHVLALGAPARIIHLVLDEGLDLSIKNDDGKTAIDIAYSEKSYLAQLYMRDAVVPEQMEMEIPVVASSKRHRPMPIDDDAFLEMDVDGMEDPEMRAMSSDLPADAPGALIRVDSLPSQMEESDPNSTMYQMTRSGQSRKLEESLSHRQTKRARIVLDLDDASTTSSMTIVWLQHASRWMLDEMKEEMGKMEELHRRNVRLICNGEMGWDPRCLYDHDILYSDVYVALQQAKYLPPMITISTVEYEKREVKYERCEAQMFNVIKYLNPKLFFYLLRTRTFISAKREYQLKKYGIEMRWEDHHMILNFSNQPPIPEHYYGRLEFDWREDGLNVAIRDALQDDRAKTLMHHLSSPQQLQNAFTHPHHFKIDHSRYVEYVRGGLDINHIIDGHTYLTYQLYILSDIEVMEVIDMGADVNKGTPPPLYYATNEGMVDVMDVLVENGANLNGMDEHGIPILVLLCEDLQHLDETTEHLTKVMGLSQLVKYSGIDVELSWNILKQKCAEIYNTIPSISHLHYYLDKTMDYLHILNALDENQVDGLLNDGWDDSVPAWFQDALDQFRFLSPRGLTCYKKKIESMKTEGFNPEILNQVDQRLTELIQQYLHLAKVVSHLPSESQLGEVLRQALIELASNDHLRVRVEDEFSGTDEEMMRWMEDPIQFPSQQWLLIMRDKPHLLAMHDDRHDAWQEMLDLLTPSLSQFGSGSKDGEDMLASGGRSGLKDGEHKLAKGSESMKKMGKPPSKQNPYTITLEGDLGKQIRTLEIIFVLGKYEETKKMDLAQLKAHSRNSIHQEGGKRILLHGKHVVVKDNKAVFSDLDYRTEPHLPSGTYHARYLLHPSSDDPHERLLDIPSHDFDVSNSSNKTKWKALDFNEKVWRCGDVPIVTFTGRFNGDLTRYQLLVKDKSYSPTEATGTKLIFQLEPEMEECEVSPIIVYSGNGTPQGYEFTNRLIFTKNSISIPYPLASDMDPHWIDLIYE
eukprot:TRINITY_DN526_c0_g1_i7.p1 TRINITY_DN526_c0_g1~~TRINITY_DN526_c0_g1_i7.p1  ORF type:complete len:1452 (-),score=293.41 TRINITY_DN526_c0_g1_i7:11-4330(-)